MSGNVATKAATDKEDLLLEAELAEIARLEREAKLVAAKLKKQKALEDLERLKRQAEGEGARSKGDFGNLHEAVDSIRTQNFVPHPSRRDNFQYTGPLMDEIRRDPLTHDKVDDLMDCVHGIPAFSNANHGGQAGRHTGRRYSYSASQLQQVTGDGIRV